MNVCVAASPIASDASIGTRQIQRAIAERSINRRSMNDVISFVIVVSEENISGDLNMVNLVEAAAPSRVVGIVGVLPKWVRIEGGDLINPNTVLT